MERSARFGSVAAVGLSVALAALFVPASLPARSAAVRVVAGRDRTSIDEDWRFHKDDAPGTTLAREDLLPWLLPTSNAFIKDPSQRKARPTDRVAPILPYAQPNFDDSTWRRLDLPHDWGVEGVFTDRQRRARAPAFLRRRLVPQSTGYSGE